MSLTKRAQRADQDEDMQIEDYIEPYPDRPDPAEYRLKTEMGGVPVWAIIGALAEDGSNTEAVARDYRVSRAAVRAAWAYYQQHMQAIDARLAANSAP
jgi:hypothetical protein